MALRGRGHGAIHRDANTVVPELHVLHQRAVIEHPDHTHGQRGLPSEIFCRDAK